MISDGYTLYLQLQNLDLLEKKPPLWWPSPYTFEMVVSAILTQNTKWENAAKALELLHANHLLTPEALFQADNALVVECIRSSGFFNVKSKNIQRLAQNIVETYGDFEYFQEAVTREWLLAQRGIGFESADAILCYGCGREIMVVDKYTQQLLEALGYTFERYEEIQSWCHQGFEKVDDLHTHFAHFHGMIVEYMKRYKKAKNIDITLLDRI